MAGLEDSVEDFIRKNFVVVVEDKALDVGWEEDYLLDVAEIGLF